LEEVIFLVEEDALRGYTAKGLGYSIYTEAETLEELKKNLRDAVSCHFDDSERPKIIRIHFVRDEVIAL